MCKTRGNKADAKGTPKRVQFMIRITYAKMEIILNYIWINTFTHFCILSFPHSRIQLIQKFPKLGQFHLPVHRKCNAFAFHLIQKEIRFSEKIEF